MRRFMALLVFSTVTVTTTLHAHEIIQKVSRDAATVIELSYPDHSPFSYEQYEVYRKGEDVPYQTGRTDALGRIVFVPDRTGDWRIRAFSENGHGIDVTIASGPENVMETQEDARSGRYGKIVLGLIIILGTVMVILVVVRRRAI